MKRLELRSQVDWRQLQEEAGYGAFSEKVVGCAEQGYYSLTQNEVDTLNSAAKSVVESYRSLLTSIGNREISLASYQLAPVWEEYVRTSWKRGDNTLCGRFDFSVREGKPPKLLEFNADTPALLFESGPLQRLWCDHYAAGHKQENLLEQALEERWKQIEFPGQTCHFTSLSGIEYDFFNVSILQETARKAGLKVAYLELEDICWDEGANAFVDTDGKEIKRLCKFYSWDWMMRDAFSQHIIESGLPVLEPAWKILCASKASLVELSQVASDNEHILAAHFQPDKLGGSYAAKPLFGRQGENVSLVWNGKTLEVPGSYGEHSMIYQELAPLPKFGSYYACVSVWIVNDAPAGIGIREGGSPVTNSRSNFAPHIIEG